MEGKKIFNRRKFKLPMVFLLAAIFTLSFFTNVSAGKRNTGNSPPVIANGSSASMSTFKNTIGEITLNANDTNGDTLSWSFIRSSSHGKASLVSSGSGGTSTATVSYAPNTDYSGTDSFKVQVSDNKGGTDFITINVSIINRAPVIVQGDVLTNPPIYKGETSMITLDATDADSDILSWILVSPATNGAAAIASVTGSGGTSAATVSYTPNADYSGSDSFQVQVSDNKGGTDTIIVNVSIQQYTLTIMHTNDSHARVERRPRIATAIKQIRSQSLNSILVDAGDVFSGTTYFDKYLGLADLWFMNDIKYDAMTLGNHEFDKGSTVLGNFIKEMTFPMVSSNVNVTNDPVLSLLFKNETVSNPTGGNIYPAIIKDVDGEKIGIFGLTYLGYTIPGIKIEDITTKARETVSSLKAQGINKIVVLSHMGLLKDQSLAANVDGIDVVVGGHSHNELTPPILVDKAEPTIIVQAGAWLKYLGVLNVTFNSSGVITSHNGSLLHYLNYAPDPEEQAKVEEFKAGLTQ